jgi:hypothetical protein
MLITILNVFFSAPNNSSVSNKNIASTASVNLNTFGTVNLPIVNVPTNSIQVFSQLNDYFNKLTDKTFINNFFPNQLELVNLTSTSTTARAISSSTNYVHGSTFLVNFIKRSNMIDLSASLNLMAFTNGIS